MKSIKNTVLFTVLAFLSVPSYTVAANFDTLTERSISDANKQWEISFSTPVDQTTVKTKNIYIKDENNRLFSTKLQLSDDGKTITVIPSRSYKAGRYSLFISDLLKSKSNQTLINPTILPFEVEMDLSASNNSTNSSSNSNSSSLISNQANSTQSNNSSNINSPTQDSTIKSVSAIAGSLITIVKVSTDASVVEVRVNNEPMHYLGGGNYNLALVGLKSGDTVKIDTYNSNSKVVYSNKYPVN